MVAFVEVVSVFYVAVNGGNDLTIDKRSKNWIILLEVWYAICLAKT